MKIIDLLNIIANMENKEDVPKKIKCRDEIWEFDQIVQDYMNVDNGDFLFTSVFRGDAKRGLNEKVEIIEEEKEIEEFKTNYTCSELDLEIIDKINELVRELNKIKKEGM